MLCSVSLIWNVVRNQSVFSPDTDGAIIIHLMIWMDMLLSPVPSPALYSTPLIINLTRVARAFLENMLIIVINFEPSVTLALTRQLVPCNLWMEWPCFTGKKYLHFWVYRSLGFTIFWEIFENCQNTTKLFDYSHRYGFWNSIVWWPPWR